MNSLGTSDFEKAKRLVAAKSAKVDRLFEDARFKFELTPHEVEELRRLSEV